MKIRHLALDMAPGNLIGHRALPAPIPVDLQVVDVLATDPEQGVVVSRWWIREAAQLKFGLSSGLAFVVRCWAVICRWEIATSRR